MIVGEGQKNQGYTIEQVRKILDICDERLKAVILLYASTGLRLAALTALKIRALTEVSLDESRNEKLYRITAYEGSIPGQTSKTNSTCNYPKKITTKINSGRCEKRRKFFNISLMKSDVHPSFKELLIGHSIKLDDVYYHKDSQKSGRKLLEEYCKAIDALTINEENRLKIKVEELTAQNESNGYVIKRRLQEKKDKLKIMEQSSSMQLQMQSLITTLGNMDQTPKNIFAKQLFSSGMYETDMNPYDNMLPRNIFRRCHFYTRLQPIRRV